MDLKNSSISSGDLPHAYKDDTMAPELVPATCDGTIPISLKNFKTPAWAMPLEPPPDSIRPMVLPSNFIWMVLPD